MKPCHTVTAFCKVAEYHNYYCVLVRTSFLMAAFQRCIHPPFSSWWGTWWRNLSLLPANGPRQKQEEHNIAGTLLQSKNNFWVICCLLSHKRESFASIWSVFGQQSPYSTGNTQGDSSCSIWQVKFKQINSFNISTTNWGYLHAW